MDPASRIAAWQRQYGRHGLPWQATRDPYRIWLSEIMLQQTQAGTVIPYYTRFLERYPDVRALADAPLDDVLQAWAGLGYYARARNLHRCAQAIRDTCGGRFPDSAERLAALPGIGSSTAAAIAAFAFGERAPILDGNVRRVLSRYYALDADPGTSAATRQLWAWARDWLAQAPDGLDMRAYTQGQMDLGATICTRTRPDCAHCPLAEDCAARKAGRQDELPRPRARRVQPERFCHIVIAHGGDAVLLERRPEHGIWGGLWSLPQFEAQEDMLAFCTRVAHGEPRRLAAFDHVFTHFRLHLQPWCAQAGNARLPIGGYAWIATHELANHGMPAPIAKLLAGLYGDDAGR